AVGAGVEGVGNRRPAGVGAPPVEPACFLAALLLGPIVAIPGIETLSDKESTIGMRSNTIGVEVVRQGNAVPPTQNGDPALDGHGEHFDGLATSPVDDQ